MTKALSHTFPDVKLAHGFSRLRAWADEFIASIAAVPDDHLVEVARGASEMEAQGFRIRGACAAEMKRRALESGGERMAGEELTRLALEAGVNFHTIKDDCRIFETFGEECLSTNIYPREVYRLALTASDPRAAVEMYAAKKAADEGYSTRDFRRDVARTDSGGREPDAPPEEDTFEVRWELTRSVLTEIPRLAEALSCDHELAVSYAIKYAAKALEEGRDIRTRI